MYATKFLVFAVLCLVTVIRSLSANVWHMEQLLQKPFWEDIVENYPNASILDYDTYELRKVSVRSVFWKNSDGSIVNQTYLNEKVRQYYNLLTLLFTDVVYYHLRYIERLAKRHNDNHLPWRLNDHILALINDYYHVYCMMDGALSLVSSMYVGEIVENPVYGDYGAPRLDRRLQRDLQNLKNVSLWPRRDLNEILGNIMNRLVTLLERYSFILSWRYSYANTVSLHECLDQVVHSNCTEGHRMWLSLSFLNVYKDKFFDEFEAIGFVYYETTGETFFTDYEESPQE